MIRKIHYSVPEKTFYRALPVALYEAEVDSFRTSILTCNECARAYNSSRLFITQRHKGFSIDIYMCGTQFYASRKIYLDVDDWKQAPNYYRKLGLLL